LPWSVRLGLAIVLTLLVAPLAGSSAVTTFDPLTFVPAAVAEACTGFALGCGSLLILWVLPLAGQLLDQQHGLPANDDGESPETPITRWLTLWGTAAFLLSSPINGHLQVVRTLADSFQSHPLGSASWLLDVNAVSMLLQQSSQLALLLIAPTLAALALINFALGLLGAAGLTSISATLGPPTRAIAAVLVLTLHLSGIHQTVADSIRGGLTDGPNVALSRSAM
jgi:flagellar biosynthetic protein FliR